MKTPPCRLRQDGAAHRPARARGRAATSSDAWTKAATSGRRPTSPSISRRPTRCCRNFQRYVELRLPVVIGTTGWNAARRDGFVPQAAAAKLGVVASANFSIGVNVFQLVVAEAARLMCGQPQYGAWIHEAHHATKRDAPSGTALLLRDAMTERRFQPPDRHVVHARRDDSGHAHDRVRLGVGYHRAHAHRARPPRLRDRRPRRRTLDSRAAGVVLDAGRPEGVTIPRHHAQTVHRCRHRLSHSVPPGRIPRRGGGQAARAPADRRRRSLPLAVRHDRRSADAEPSREAARRRAGRRRGQGRVPVLAGAGGYDTREVDRAGARHGAGRRATGCCR